MESPILFLSLLIVAVYTLLDYFVVHPYVRKRYDSVRTNGEKYPVARLMIDMALVFVSVYAGIMLQKYYDWNADQLEHQEIFTGNPFATEV